MTIFMMNIMLLLFYILYYPTYHSVIQWIEYFLDDNIGHNISGYSVHTLYLFTIFWNLFEFKPL